MVARGLYKRGSVFYSRFAGPDGRMVRRRLSPDRKTAEAMLAELRRTAEKQRAGILPTTFTPKLSSLEDIKKRYLGYMRARRRALGTVENFLFAWKRVVRDIGWGVVQDVTKESLDAWCARQTIRHQTINVYVGSIKAMFRWARDDAELIPANPLAGWKKLKASLPKERRDLRPEEVRAIMDAETDPLWRLRWMVYFYTGLRNTAGRVFRWEWLDWTRSIIEIPPEANKSARLHTIPLHPALLDALQRRWEETAKPRCGGVFPLVAACTLLVRFKAACRAAGVDTRGVCVHSVRHTVATQVYEGSGRNLKAVQEFLGHADGSTTMRYLHSTVEEQRSAVESLPY